MKKNVKILSLVFLLSLMSLTGVLASCDLSVSLINQAPYPATPGDYVELVFQVDGVGNAECGKVQFGLMEQYPLIFDPDMVRTITIDAGTYQKDFSSFLMAPYKVRVDENALDGDNPIEVEFRSGSDINYRTESFNLNIQDTKADFEIYIKNYRTDTKILTLEILNTEDVDVEALTITIPPQENIKIKGPNTNIVGDLDSNEYTTADFEATLLEGEIDLTIIYTDSINERRTLDKTIIFNPEYFEDRASDTKKKGSFTGTLFWILLLINIFVYFYKKYKKKKAKKNKLKK